MDNNANAVMVIGALACGVAYVYAGGWSNDLIPVAIFIVFLWGLATWQLRLDKVTNKMIREKNEAEVKLYHYKARLARAKADALDHSRCDDESPGTTSLMKDNEYLRQEIENKKLKKELKTMEDKDDKK